MCYGEIISERLQRTRRPRACDVCGRLTPKGKLRYVQVLRDDGLRQFDACIRCVAITNSLPRDYDGCAVGDRGSMKDEVTSVGWRDVLRKARNTKRRLLERLSPRKALP